MLKVLAHALACCAALHLLRTVLTGPGFALVLGSIELGGFTVVSLVAAGVLHRQPPVVLIVLGVALIATYPDTDVIRIIIPVGGGVLLGTLLRSLVVQEPVRRSTTE